MPGRGHIPLTQLDSCGLGDFFDYRLQLGRGQRRVVAAEQERFALFDATAGFFEQLSVVRLSRDRAAIPAQLIFAIQSDVDSRGQSVVGGESGFG